MTRITGLGHERKVAQCKVIKQEQGRDYDRQRGDVCRWSALMEGRYGTTDDRAEEGR